MILRNLIVCRPARDIRGVDKVLLHVRRLCLEVFPHIILFDVLTGIRKGYRESAAHASDHVDGTLDDAADVHRIEEVSALQEGTKQGLHLVVISAEDIGKRGYDVRLCCVIDKMIDKPAIQFSAKEFRRLLQGEDHVDEIIDLECT